MTETATVSSKPPFYFSHFLRKPDYFEEQRQEFKPILDEFLYTTETMLFYGAAGSAKSLFTFGLCCAYADENTTEFLGQQIGSGKVLYIDGEMHANTIDDRVKLFEAEDLKYLRYLPVTEIVDKGHTVNLSDDVQRRSLVEMVGLEDYDLVVIDSVRTLFDLPDENSSQSWNPVNDLAMQLRSKGASVIVIHHSNKSSYTDGEVIWSGSSNAVTVFDRTCGIERVADSTWSLVTGHKVGRSGHNYGDWLDSQAFVLDEFGKNFRLIDLEDERVTKLVEFFEDYAPMGETRKAVRAIYKLLGVNASQRGASYKECWRFIAPMLEGVELPFNHGEIDFLDFLKTGGVDDDF